MTQERRRFPRVPESFPAQCRRSGSGEPWQEIHTINVSAGGLRFLSQLPFDKGDQLDLHLTLPGVGGEVELGGTVMWITSRAAGVVEVGVQFDNLTPDQEAQIDEVVDFLMKRPYPSPPENRGS